MACCFKGLWRKQQAPPKLEVSAHSVLEEGRRASSGPVQPAQGSDEPTLRVAEPLNPLTALRVQRTPVDSLLMQGLLGVGTFGRVYTATLNGTPCAAKVIELTIRPGQERLLAQERLLHARLRRHPNIVSIYSVSALALPGMPEAMPVPLDPAAAAAAGDDGLFDAFPVVRSSVATASSGRQQALGGRRPRYLDEQRGSDTPPSRELIEELGLRRAPSEPQPLETWPEPALPIHGAGSGGTASSSLPLPATPENSDGATALSGLEVVSSGSRPLVVEGGEEIGAPVPASLTDSLSVGMYEVWLLCEFCDRGSLADYVFSRRLVRRADGSQNVPLIFELLMEVARGLEYLHVKADIVHGNLQMGNIMLQGRQDVQAGERSYVAKVADFGLNALLDTNQTFAQFRTMDTVGYLAPEVITKGQLSRASDVYAFGVVMYELWTSERVFAGQPKQAVFSAVTRGDFRLPVPPDSPMRFSNLMRICWEREPANRPTMAMIRRELRDELKEIQQYRSHSLEGLELEQFLASTARAASAKSSKSLEG